MKLFAADIIVPVWNKPEKTRLCLTELVKHTPEARFILIDNASERETEVLMHEFAEALGERALLFRNNRAIESVAVVNMGLARAEAPFAVLVDNSTVVGKGWLGPMLDIAANRPEVGLAVPDFCLKENRHPEGKKHPQVRSIEVSHGSFAALMVRKTLYDKIGGFEENMDGGEWCLKDYSRRAWDEGFITVNVSGATVAHMGDAQLGSPARREERIRESMTKFVARWGEKQSFCVDMSGKSASANLKRQFEVMLYGARLGRSYVVLAHRGTCREIVRNGYDFLHKNITVVRLPSLFASGSADRALSRLRKSIPGLKMISFDEQHACQLCRVDGDSPTEANNLPGGPDA